MYEVIMQDAEGCEIRRSERDTLKEAKELAKYLRRYVADAEEGFGPVEGRIEITKDGNDDEIVWDAPTHPPLTDSHPSPRRCHHRR